MQQDRQYIVVEPSSIRGSAADFPLFKHLGHIKQHAFISPYAILSIFSTFATFTPVFISTLRCSLIDFRNFQQFSV